MFRRYPAVAGLVLGACSWLGCGDGSSGPVTSPVKGQDSTSASQPRPVKLVQVQLASMARAVTVTGTLAADERVTLSAKVPGRLASIAVDLGSPVQAGQVIAQIEPTDYRLRVEQAASAVAQARALLGLSPEGDDEVSDVEATSLVREAQATLLDAQARLQRAEQLAQQKLVSAADLDTTRTEALRAQSSLENARDQVRGRQAALRQRRSELASARQQLTDSQVRASIDGIVEQRHASAGEFLAAAAPIATIVRTDPLRLRVEIPERDAGSVRIGQDVRVTIAGDSEAHLGKIARMSPTISEQTRTLTVEAEIPNPGTLRPGSFARGEIAIEDAGQALVVPASAVVTFAGIEKVVTVEDGKAVEKRITTGRRTAEQVEVLKGLEAGDAIVLAPGNLQQGQAVAVEAR